MLVIHFPGVSTDNPIPPKAGEWGCRWHPMNECGHFNKLPGQGLINADRTPLNPCEVAGMRAPKSERFDQSALREDVALRLLLTVMLRMFGTDERCDLAGGESNVA